MAVWKVFDFKGGSGRSVIEQWIDELSEGSRERVRAKLEAMLSVMRKTELAQWPPDWTTQITGYAGLYELRFKVKKVQYRPLFFFGPGDRHEITLLTGAIEKNDQIIPRGAFDTASERIALARRDGGRICEHR